MDESEKKSPFSEEDFSDLQPLSELEKSEVRTDTSLPTEVPFSSKEAWWHPTKLQETVMRTFLEIRPVTDSHKEAASETSKRLGVPYSRVFGIVQKALLQREARIQRRNYADKIYEEKVPLAKSIVGKSLTLLDNFLSSFNPLTIEDAKGLSKVATDVTNLLRLELGQATQQIEIMHKTNKSVTVIMDELRKGDPFMDYDSKSSEVSPEPDASLAPVDGRGS